jgi:hypothetical protein
LLTHSGLQFGGAPINSGKQEHDGKLFTTRHCALGPQGDGSQGLSCGGEDKAKIKIIIFKIREVLNKLNHTVVS